MLLLWGTSVLLTQFLLLTTPNMCESESTSHPKKSSYYILQLTSYYILVLPTKQRQQTGINTSKHKGKATETCFFYLNKPFWRRHTWLKPITTDSRSSIESNNKSHSSVVFVFASFRLETSPVLYYFNKSKTRYCFRKRKRRKMLRKIKRKQKTHVLFESHGTTRKGTWEDG